MELWCLRSSGFWWRWRTRWSVFVSFVCLDKHVKECTDQPLWSTIHWWCLWWGRACPSGRGSTAPLIIVSAALLQQVLGYFAVFPAYFCSPPEFEPVFSSLTLAPPLTAPDSLSCQNLLHIQVDLWAIRFHPLSERWVLATLLLSPLQSWSQVESHRQLTSVGLQERYRCGYEADSVSARRSLKAFLDSICLILEKAHQCCSL